MFYYRFSQIENSKILRIMFFLTLTNLSFVYAQNTNDDTDFSSGFFLQVANRMSMLDQPEKALVYYDLAFSNGAFTRAIDYYYAAQNAIKANQKYTTFYYLKKSIEYGLLWKTIINDSIFSGFLSSKMGEELVSNHEIYRRNYKNALNQELIDECTDISSVDRFIRHDFLLSNQYTADEQEEAFKVIDSLYLFPRILKLASNPSLSSYALGEHYKDLVLMIRHQTGHPTQFEQLIPLIEQLRDNKVISPYNFAQIMNSYYLQKNGQQVFATHYFEDELSGKVLLYPIYKPEELNKRRVAIGIWPTFMKIEPLSLDYPGHLYSWIPKDEEVTKLEKFIMTFQCLEK